MKHKFIEVTEKDGSKILLNIFHIAWIEPNKEGTLIRFNIDNYSFPKKVTEPYDQVKSLVRSDD